MTGTQTKTSRGSIDKNPLTSPLRGYVRITTGPDGMSVGGYSCDADRLRRRPGDGAVVSMERARAIAREFHDWDIPSEERLREAAMVGEL